MKNKGDDKQAGNDKRARKRQGERYIDDSYKWKVYG